MSDGPEACECGHLCRYAAEHGLDPQLEALRAWCCICDGREPCSVCAPLDTPEAKQQREKDFEVGRKLVEAALTRMSGPHEVERHVCDTFGLDEVGLQRVALFLLAHAVVDTRLITLALFKEISRQSGGPGLSRCIDNISPR